MATKSSDDRKNRTIRISLSDYFFLRAISRNEGITMAKALHQEIADAKSSKEHKLKPVKLTLKRRFVRWLLN